MLEASLYGAHLLKAPGDRLEARCPVCGRPVEVPDDAVPGELLDHECGVTLEILREGDGLLRLAPFEGVGEDWGE